MSFNFTLSVDSDYLDELVKETITYCEAGTSQENIDDVPEPLCSQFSTTGQDVRNTAASQPFQSLIFTQSFMIIHTNLATIIINDESQKLIN